MSLSPKDPSESIAKGVERRLVEKIPQVSRKLALIRYFKPVEEDLEQVDQRIRQQAEFFDPGICGYIQYATESSGKRIRPALALLSARASGKCLEHHIDLAVVVELIHLASLVHDDVLDNAEIRRSRPTLNTKWGAELSVLLGDCLFSHALKLCTRFPDTEISRVIADAANEVCTGEILQTQRRYDLNLPISDYLKIIGMKTGALFRVGPELAAKINGSSEAVIAGFRVYGECLGIAYQIYDDCLDLFGQEDQFGKTLGTDLKKGKLTLPVLHLLGQLNKAELEDVSETILHGDEEDQVGLVRRVVESGGHIYAVRKTRELLEKSRRSLEGMKVNPYLKALQQLTDSFIEELDVLKR